MRKFSNLFAIFSTLRHLVSVVAVQSCTANSQIVNSLWFDLNFDLLGFTNHWMKHFYAEARKDD